MLFFYRIVINLTLLISPLIIIYRLLKKKEDPKRFLEKYTITEKKNFEGDLIWFHGSSVGEILSIIPLVEKYEKRKSIKKILITSNTLSSSKVIKKLKLKKNFSPIFSFGFRIFSRKIFELLETKNSYFYRF